MKLTLSKRGDERGKHLVVVCNLAEYADLYPLLLDVVTRGRNIDRTVNRDRDEVRMRFALRYLEKLMLTVPFATLSVGVEKMLLRAEKNRLAEIPVPDIVIPGCEREPWPYQKIMIDKLAREEVELCNDDVGLGKTFEVLSALAMKEWFPALVVVGSIAGKYVWETEARECFPKVRVQVVEGTKAQKARQIRKAGDFDITIVNCQALRIKQYVEVDGDGQAVYEHFERNGVWDSRPKTIKEIANPGLFEVPWECLVVDEYHKFKNPSAQQSVGFQTIEAGRDILASGTPIMGAPEDAWSFIHRIDPDFAGTYYHFETRIGRYTQNGRKIGYDPEEMLLLRNWLFEHSFRRRKEHVSDELPEVIHSQQLVELTPEQRRLYIKIRDEMQLEMEDGETKNIGWARHQVMRLKQACFSPELYGGSKESGKITQIKQDVADLVASGHKAIVFSEWRTAARILQRELAQYNPAYVDGTIKGRDRQAEEQRFNHDPECKLYIGTIRANQEAITLNAATYVLFADEEWMSLANYQAENRSAGGGMRGLGVETAVNVIRYQGADTIEQGFGERLRRQQRTFNVTVERDGGINTKRQNIRRVMDLLRNA